MSKPAKDQSKCKPHKKAAAYDRKRQSERSQDRVFDSALCLIGETGGTIFGLTTEKRIEKQFAREGVDERISLEQAMDRNGPVIFVRSDAVIDQPLIPILAKRPNLMLVSDDDSAATAIAITMNGLQADAASALLLDGGADPGEFKLIVRSPADLGAAFWKGLRKRETPYARRVTSQTLREIEWRMFVGTYKGATDFVTKHVWPRPAFAATRALAPTQITPNMVTTVGAFMVVLAFWLFLEGFYFAGLTAAWLMTFLDTVDGKLARTTLTTSKWGDIFDHGIDLIHPPFWYAAWAMSLLGGLSGWTDQLIWWTLSVIIVGYILQRLMEGAAIKWLGLEIHIWRPVDTLFRQITARRNPNLALLTAFTLVGRPDWGFMAVAVWTVVCLILHGIQLLQAFAARRAGGELKSWMNAPTASK